MCVVCPPRDKVDVAADVTLKSRPYRTMATDNNNSQHQRIQSTIERDGGEESEAKQGNKSEKRHSRAGLHTTYL